MTTNLPEMLKQLRIAKGLKQSTVAAELDIEQSAYSNYETGKRKPSAEMLYRLSDLYGVSVDTLMRLAVQDDSDSDSANVEYGLDDHLSDDDGPIKEFSDYLKFVNDPYNREKCKRLSSRETELIYFYGQLSDADQEDFLDFIKIRTRKKRR